MRGNLWLARGDNDRAISDFSVALGLDPNNTDAYVNRGVAWYAKDDNDRAIADYDMAIRTVRAAAHELSRFVEEIYDDN